MDVNEAMIIQYEMYINKNDKLVTMSPRITNTMAAIVKVGSISWKIMIIEQQERKSAFHAVATWSLPAWY